MRGGEGEFIYLLLLTGSLVGSGREPAAGGDCKQCRLGCQPEAHGHSRRWTS